MSDNHQTVPLKELAEMIAEISHVKVIYGEEDALQKKGASSFQNVRLSSKKLLDLGWEPQFSMMEGLQRTIYALRN